MAWPDSSPTFPKAQEAGQYLKSYISTYPGLEIKTSSKVLKAYRSSGTAPHEKRWKIEIEKRNPASRDKTPSIQLNDTSNKSSAPMHVGSSSETQSSKPSIETHYFDYCIVASGFFGEPKLPSGFSSSLALVQHSTQFRKIESLLHDCEARTSVQGNKILVVGGSMSGAEVAASIAMQLSSHVHSPKTSLIKDVGKYIVHHVVRRPFWIMPLFLPVKPMLEVNPDAQKVRYSHSPSECSKRYQFL
jgi:hypothetical protein